MNRFEFYKLKVGDRVRVRKIITCDDSYDYEKDSQGYKKLIGKTSKIVAIDYDIIEKFNITLEFEINGFRARMIFNNEEVEALNE